MVDIALNDKYGIETDKYNYILYRNRISKGKKTKGEVQRVQLYYCNTLRSAILKYCDEILKDSKATSFNEYIEHLNILEQRLKDVASRIEGDKE